MKVLSCLVCLILIGGMPGFALANATPVVIQESAAYPVVPAEGTPIAVTGETLVFDLREGRGDKAAVTAEYRMVNTSVEPIKQAMLFPFVTAYWKGFTDSIQILADGQAVPFTMYRFDDVDLMIPSAREGNPMDEHLFNLIVPIGYFFEQINRPEVYVPRNYEYDQIVTVYTLPLLGRDVYYTADVSFHVDPKETILLGWNFSGYSVEQDGRGTLSAWSAPADAEGRMESAMVAVLGNGADSAVLVSEDSQVTLQQEEITLMAFLNRLAEAASIHADVLYQNTFADPEVLLAYAVRRLDALLDHPEVHVFFADEILGTYIHSLYAGALLYEIEFQPAETRTITVSYTMRGAMDRRTTRQYAHKFLYLLQPAARWKDFQDLSLRILPNEHQAYLIESSLPMERDGESGTYLGFFESLPEQDFYFAMYSTDQPDPPISQYRPSRRLLYSSLGLAGILSAGIWFFMQKRKKRSITARG